VKNFGIFNIIHDGLAIDRELFPDQLVWHTISSTA
jgi:hypothetical protein